MLGAALRCSQATAAPSVQSCLQVLHRHRVEIVVVDVVLARPGNLDRLASELLRQQRGFDREVRLDLRPKPPPEASRGP